MRKSKFLSILLALCLTLSLLPTAALADGGTNYVKASYELNGVTQTFEGTTLREVNDKMRTYWEVNDANGCGYNVDKLPADGTGTLTWTVYGTVQQGDYKNSGALILPALSGGYIYHDGTYQWDNINVVAGTEDATIVSYSDFDVAHTYISCGKTATTFTGITISGGIYAMPAAGTIAFNDCTFTGQLRVPNGAGTMKVNHCNFTAQTAAQDSNGYVFHYQGGGKLEFTNNNVANGYKRGLNIDNASLTATVSGNTLGTVADAGRSAIQITNATKLEIAGNNITLNGGNAFTLHEALAANSDIDITGNTITGTGYLFYDESKNAIDLTYSGNTVDETINTTEGIKGTTVTPNGTTVSGAVHPAASINGVTYPTLTAAIQAASNGDTIVLMPGVTVTLDSGIAHEGNKARTVTIQGDGTQTVDVITNAVNAEGGKLNYQRDSKFTFDNVTVQAGEGNFDGIVCSELTLNHCTVKGKLTLYGKATFTGCTFENTMANQYSIWTWGGTDVKVENCTFDTNGKAILLYGQATEANPTNLTVSNTVFNDRTSGAAGKAAIEIGNDYNATYTLAASGCTVNGFAEGKNTGSTLWANKNSMSADNLTVSKDGEVVYGNGIATVGGKTYTSLPEAFAALNAENHTLALSAAGEREWSAATPVYWQAGAQSDYAATLTAALTAAYQANAGAITIVCRPGATVTASNDGVHYNVTNNLTIYANNADFSGKDLSIGTYAAPKNSETTINIYDAKNLVVWGQPVGDRADVWNVNFVDCENNGHNFLMYRGGETGKATLNATLTGCKATGFSDSIIHTTADGSIKITNCTFADNCAPVNIAHKQSGSMVVEIEGCTFTNCGKLDESNNYYAPVRMVNNNAQGTLSVSVKNTAFAGTIGDNGDILLGDGRNGKESYDVSATVTGTAAKVVAQRPGHYNGSAVDLTKQESKTLTANDTLSTTLNEMLPLKGTVTLDEFLAMVEAYGYNFDGAAVTGDGSKLTVKWSPVSGCYDTRAGHQCTVKNVAATGNTPKRVNSGLTQFQLYEGENYNVSVKNVSFVYEPAAFTVCENSNWKGSFTAADAPAGQLYFMTTGDVTFESCDFDKVVLTTFNTTGTSTVKNCTFANVYNNYAIKDIRGEHIIVTGNTITNCGGGIMVSSTGTVSDVNISGNTFTNVDAAGTAPEEKVGTRGLIQIAASGDYTNAKLILNGNTASNCGPILRQLNENGAAGMIENRLTGDLTGLGGKLTYTSDSVSKASQPTTYTVTFSGSNVAPVVAAAGTTIILPNADRVGFTLSYWKDWTNGAAYRAGESFTVTANVTLYAEWVENSSPVTPGSSSVSVVRPDNGKVTVNPSAAKEGETVTITVTPDAGYELGSLTVSDSRGNQLPLSGSGSSFTFVMPAGGAVVKAEFVKRSVSFSDVSANDYFASAVAWAVEKGITDGVGSGLFGPYQPCTRAQIVTFLWRAAGSPEPKAMSSFADVSANEYYAKAVAWAVENGITTGTTATTFGPNDTCTRAQAVTFLCRAVGTQGAYSGAFSDVASDMYCAGSVAWAVANGVTDGVGGGRFAPDDFCTRGQIVTFLYRAYQGK